jgi:peptidoglycan/LPS O-acetylase OafA/YrhL
VDGLRALAIVPVVLYDYWPGSLGGGFVGVDVFFVISGFLITSILLRGIAQGQFSLVAFYERRARRILPAMFFMLAVTTLLSLGVLLPADLSHYGKSLVATTTFVSNVFFWQELGYFDRAAELKPLLHTWSLSSFPSQPSRCGPRPASTCR